MLGFRLSALGELGFVVDGFPRTTLQAGLGAGL